MNVMMHKGYAARVECDAEVFANARD